MRSIAVIVEGKGEVEAVPILLQRIAQRVAPGLVVKIPPPFRVRRTRVLKPGELEGAVEFAARRAGAEGGILILLDADKDCPRELASELLERARAARQDRVIRVVLAKTEYEAWFLASAGSVAGRRGIAESLAPHSDPESVSDAKGWLSGKMPSGQSYRPTLHQAALTKVFDLDCARKAAPSFDKMWRDVVALLAIHGER